MGKDRFTIIIFVLILIVTCAAVKAQSNSSKDLEYKLKAAFLYNFIKFVDWPEKKETNDNNTIIIGIIGKSNFGDAFVPVQEKKVKGQKTVIQYFKSFRELEKSKNDLNNASEEMKKCHLLFICSSENDDLPDILNIVKNNNVLTVGETGDFLKTGGIINFLLEENKVRFEINLIAARDAKLTIRSQLLRLAQRVIDENGSK